MIITPDCLALAEKYGLSVYDVNGRIRERRLGYKAPSMDWANCKVVIRCLWEGQKVTGNLGHAVAYFHKNPSV